MCQIHFPAKKRGQSCQKWSLKFVLKEKIDSYVFVCTQTEVFERQFWILTLIWQENDHATRSTCNNIKGSMILKLEI